MKLILLIVAMLFAFGALLSSVWHLGQYDAWLAIALLAYFGSVAVRK